MAGRNATFNIGIKTTADLTGINQIKTQLQEIKRLAGSSFTEGMSAQSLNQMVASATKLDAALTKAFDQKLGIVNVQKFNQALKQSGTTLSEVQMGLANAGAMGQKAFLRTTGEILKMSNVTKQAHTISQKFATSFLNTARWMATSSILNTMMGSFQKIWSYTKDLDTSLNNIQIVTGKSAEDMKEFAKYANQSAQALGATTTSYTDASLIYYQQGLDDEAVRARTDVTMKMANVMGQTASQVSDYMTAIWNNFDDGSKSMEYYADVITNLGAHTASSAEEIAEGLEKFAAVSNTVGLSYEYATTALATVVAQTRQTPEIVGTAFKTLFARIESLKLGDTLDDGTTLGQYSQALEKVGINIKDQAGELKDMDDILDEMGAKWQTLSKDQQVALAQQVAGVRQYTQLIALMDNWDVFNQNLNTANTSVGRLSEEQETYMESIKAHLQTLKATSEDLYDSLLGSGQANKVIDTGTEAIKIITRLVDTLGGLPGVLTLVGSLMLRAFSGQIAQSLLTSANNIEIMRLKTETLGVNMQEIARIAPELAEKMEAAGADELLKTESINAAMQDLVQFYQDCVIHAKYMTEEQQRTYEAILQSKIAVGEMAIDLEHAGQKKLTLFGGQEGIRNIQDVDKAVENLRIVIDGLESKITTIEELKTALASIGFEAEDVEKFLRQMVGGAENGIITFDQLREALTATANEASTFGMKLNDLDAKMKVNKTSAEELKGTLSFTGAIQNITQLTSNMGMLAMSFVSIINLTKTWSNETMTTSEKLLQTVASVGMMAPMMVTSLTQLSSGFSNLGTSLMTVTAKFAEAMTGTGVTAEKVVALEAESAALAKKNAIQQTTLLLDQAEYGEYELLLPAQAELVAAIEAEDIARQKKIITQLEEEGLINAETAAKLRNTIATKAKTTATRANSQAIKENTILMIKWMLSNPIGWIMILVGGIIALTAAITIYNKKLEKATQKQQEFANNARKSYEDAQSAFNDLVGAWEEYETGVDVMQELTRGTVDYYKALETANEKAQSLIDTYDELEGHYRKNAEGLIEFDDYAEQFIEDKEKSTNLLGAAADQAQIQANNAQLEYNGSHSAGNNTFSRKDIRSYEEDGFSAYYNNADDYIKLTLDDNAINALSEATQEKGSDLTAEEIEQTLKTYSPESWQDSYSAIIEDNTSGINSLIDSNQQLIDSNEALVQSRTDKELSSTYGNDYTDKSEAEKDYITSQLASDTTYTSLKDDKFNSYYTSYDHHDQENRDWYAEQYGLRVIDTSDKNQVVFLDANGEEITKTYSEMVGIRAEAMSMADEAVKDAQDNVISQQEALSDILYSEGLSLGMTDAAAQDFADKALTAINTGEVSDLNNAIWTVPPEQQEELKHFFSETASEFGGKLSDETIDNFNSGSSEYYESQSGLHSANANSVEEYLRLDNKDKALTKNEQNEYAELTNTVNALAEEYGYLAEMEGNAIDKNIALREMSDIEEAKSYTDELNRSNEAQAEQNELIAEKERLEEQLANTIGNERGALEREIQELQQKIDDYELEIKVDINLDDLTEADIKDAFGIADDLNSLTELIKDDLTYTAEEIQELIDQGYGAMLENAKPLTDGMIQLDNQVVDAFLDGQQVKLDSQVEEKTQELELEKQALQAQLGVLELKRQALQTAAEASTEDEAAEALAKAQIYEKEYENQKEALATQVANDSIAKEQMSANATELYNLLNDAYNQDAQNAADADESANTAAEEYQSNVIDFYEAMTAAANTYGAAVKAAEDGTGPVEFDIDKVSGSSITKPTHTGAEVTNDYKGTKDPDFENFKNLIKSHSDLADIQQTARQQLADTDAQINSIKAQMGAIDGAIAAMHSGTAGLDKRQGNKGSSSGSGGSGGSGDKGKDLTPKNYDDEFDRYWEFNKAIDEAAKSLDKLGKIQDHVFGYELINNLKQQNEQLAIQKANYEALGREQQKEAEELRTFLSKAGASFDGNGNLTNYASLTSSLIDSYNKGVIDDDTYDAVKSAIERYDELFYDEMKENAENIADIVQQTLDNNLKMFETEVQVKLDLSEAERDWEEFLRDIATIKIDGLDVGTFTLERPDLLAGAQSKARSAATYSRNNGTIATDLAAIARVDEEIAKLQAGEKSDMFGSVSEAEEKRKELVEQYRSDMKDFYSLWEDTYEDFLDGIDQSADALEDINDKYELINDQLEHQQTLIELLYGDDAYDKMDKYYKSLENNQLGQMDSLRQQKDMWKNLYDNAEEGSKEQAKYYKLWQDAQKDLNKLVEDYIKTLQEDYLNTVHKVIDETQKSINGGKALDEVKQNWEDMQDMADGYYDDIERLYQIQKVQNDFQTAINDTSSLKYQQKLKKLMDDELANLENQEELSEYDVELAEKKLAIAKAQVALEDAQNNKNSMKLTRGADGNWSYQYVADDDDALAKQQDLMDKLNDYYELTKERQQEMIESYINIQQDYWERYAKIMEDTRISDEEKAVKTAELYDLYWGENGFLTRVQREYAKASIDLNQATAENIWGSYVVNQENFERMTGEQQLLWQTLNEQIQGDWFDTELFVNESYSAIEEGAKSVNERSLDYWTTTAKAICDAWNADDGVSVKAQVINSISECDKAFDEYLKKIDLGTKAAGEDFRDVEGAIDECTQATAELDGATATAVSNINSYLSGLYSTFEEVTRCWNNIGNATLAAAEAASAYANAAIGAGNAALYQAAAQQAATGANTGTGSRAPSTGTTPTKTNNSGGGMPKIPTGYHTVSSQEMARTWNGNTGNNRYVVIERNDLKEKLKLYADGHVERFASGGYTGVWGNEGRLAMLHQKELVLNADDTENMLAAVNSVRDIASIGTSITNSIATGIGNLLLGMNNKVSGVSPVTTNESSNNVFNITAEFPNANDVNEIRQAILSLPNLASQYMGRR